MGAGARSGFDGRIRADYDRRGLWNTSSCYQPARQRPMLQFYSFDLNDPLIRLADWNLSFQIITLENVYGLDPDTLRVDEAAGGWTVSCSRLSWAGQQRRAPGSFHADIVRETGSRLR